MENLCAAKNSFWGNHEKRMSELRSELDNLNKRMDEMEENDDTDQLLSEIDELLKSF